MVMAGESTARAVPTHRSRTGLQREDSRREPVPRLHTLVWAIFAGSIVAIPLLARAGAHRWALALAALVFVEVIVLALNRMRCPLTAVAARYTDDRRDNFDIYLPEWLARWNKHVFGILYVAGLLVLWASWAGRAD
jgi:hypothetical protein